MSDIETAEALAQRIHANHSKQMTQNEIKARDAAIARAAKVDVLRDALGCLAMKDGFVCSHDERVIRTVFCKDIHDIASRHSIAPHEIEPRKVYTEADIKVECEDESINTWVIRCGDMGWNEDEWVKYDERDSSVYSKHDAEAIASHLRATGNVPGVK